MTQLSVGIVHVSLLAPAPSRCYWTHSYRGARSQLLVVLVFLMFTLFSLILAAQVADDECVQEIDAARNAQSQNNSRFIVADDLDYLVDAGSVDLVRFLIVIGLWNTLVDIREEIEIGGSEDSGALEVLLEVLAEAFILVVEREYILWHNCPEVGAVADFDNLADGWVGCH